MNRPNDDENRALRGCFWGRFNPWRKEEEMGIIHVSSLFGFGLRNFFPNGMKERVRFHMGRNTTNPSQV